MLIASAAHTVAAKTTARKCSPRGSCFCEKYSFPELKMLTNASVFVCNIIDNNLLFYAKTTIPDLYLNAYQ